MFLKLDNHKGDIQWINTMKVICLFLVFLFHSEYYCGIRFYDFTSYYVRFYVNSFFFLSGFLLFNKQLYTDLINLDAKEWWLQKGGGRTILRNGFWRIIVPTIIFCTLIYFPKAFLRGDVISLKDYCIDSILGKSSWFTWALFWAEVLMVFALLSRIKNVWLYFVFGVLMAVIAYLIKLKGIVFLNDEAMPWNYRQGLLACVFLAYGGLYKQYENQFNKLFMSKIGVFILLFLFVFYLLALYFKTPLDSNLTLKNYLLSFLSILILASLCKLFKGNSVTQYIGRHSIGFFFVCGGLPNVFAILLDRLLPFSTGAFLPMIVAIISFVIAFFLVYVLNEYLPFLFDLRLLWKKKD